MGLSAGLAALALSAERASAQTSQPGPILRALGEGQTFSPGAVVELARELARQPFKAPPTDIPEPFSNLNYERYVAIRMRAEHRIWAEDDRGFSIEPLVRGFIFGTPVHLFTVEGGRIRSIGFDAPQFEFGELKVPPGVDPRFSGFRLYARGGATTPDLLALIQGATFVRAVARGQNFGAMARALTLNPAEQRGEEFPLFRAFWIETPPPDSNALILHGLIDSPSMAGVVRMTVRPGEATVFDVETTIIPRVALEHVGFGGSAASFLFGPNVRVTSDDVRVGAYEVGGLSMFNGKGEWIWRPLNNPGTLQISAFQDRNPRGFGLLQRDRDLASFQDDIQHYERRPTLWIEPIGDWGEGAIQLIEIPSDAETNKNILSYWRPKNPIPAGQELTFSYRQFWAWEAQQRPDLAWVAATRSGHGGGKRRRFLIEFRGDNLASPPASIQVTQSASPGTIQNVNLWLHPERKAARVAFDLEYGNETACEMRVLLEADGKALSETWLYRWTA